ncbi:MAG: hypothetical protein M1834_000400 [Cirrosporium novae-zelandiae]|nr:MAG: hypothetical protein M1834_000400 [Cirrosporium novae-zelandiae]
MADYVGLYLSKTPSSTDKGIRSLHQKPVGHIVKISRFASHGSLPTPSVPGSKVFVSSCDITASRRTSQMGLVFNVTLLGILLQFVGLGRASKFFTFNGIKYFSEDRIVSTLGVDAYPLSLGESVPLTVITTNGTTLTADFLESIIQAYRNEDDVWSPAFLKSVYIQYSGSGSNVSLGPEATAIFNRYGVHLTISSRSNPNATLVPNGPYILSSTGNIHQVYRLYEDIQGAFIYGTIPTENGGYTYAPNFPGQATQSIPVPSRLYFGPRTAEKPLSGVRVGVKDVYDIKGLKTGSGSRAYFELYPEKNASAPAVQRLFDLGAILVGKTKTSQFANGESPTADWVDIHAPFNPRGEGYQTPSSSSAGSAAGLAAYDWLDHTIGTDTSGSIRFPAGYNGLYGARVSTGTISMNATTPTTPQLDIAGAFARDAKSLSYFAKAWYGQNRYLTYPSFPKKLLVASNNTIGGFPASQNSSQAIYSSFITKVQKFLGAEKEYFNILDLWDQTSSMEKDLYSYTHLKIAWYQQYHTLALPFYAAYAAAIPNSPKPYVNPKSRLQAWSLGSNWTSTDFDAALTQKATFATWWHSNAQHADNKSCSDSIMVYPMQIGVPAYRDEYFEITAVNGAFAYNRISILAEAPDFVVPIGQVAYFSELSETVEWLPVSVSIVARKGCDYMLFDLLAGLQEAGILKGVKTGRRTF